MSLAVATFDQALPAAAPVGTIGQAPGAPAWVHLLPPGRIVGRDGRTLTLADPDALLAAFAQGAIDLPVDYEHQNDKADPGRTGPVPAAGWIKELMVRAGSIWGRVEWTARARELIAAKEYRFLSPVILHTKDGLVARLKGASLVHNPNLYLTALAAQEDPMSDELDFKARLAEALGLAPGATADAMLEEIVALVAARKSLDPKKFVPIETMAEALRGRNEQLALQAEQVAQAKVEDAFRKGYLTTPMREWALSLCRVDPESFDTFLASAIPQFPHPARGSVVRPAGGPSARAPGGSPDEQALCRQLGLAPDALAT